MRARRHLLLVAAVAALALAVAVVGVRSLRSGAPSPPPLLVEAVEIMPPEAAERGLYYSAQAGTFASGYGFAPGLVEPAVAQAYGIRGEHITAVLESGGPASTVLLGEFPVDDIVASFGRQGYDRSSLDGWTVVTAGPQAQGPLTAGAQTVAVRPDAVVIAAAGELASLGAGESAAASRWVSVLVPQVPSDATAVALGPSPGPGTSDGPAAGTSEGPAEGRSPTAWLLAVAGEGDRRDGVVAQAFDEGAGPAAAGELAGRIRAAGAGAAGLTVEPLDPRWDAQRHVAIVPITAAAAATGWQDLRRRLEAGDVTFLHGPDARG